MEKMSVREREIKWEAKEGVKGDNDRKRESEMERGVFRGPALAGWHLTICQNSPRPSSSRDDAAGHWTVRLRWWWPSASPFAPSTPLTAPRAPLPPPPPRVPKIREYRRTLPVTVDCHRKRPRAAPAGLRAHSARFPISTRATRLLY